MHEYVPSNAQIWHVSWRPFLDGLFPAKTMNYQVVPSDVPSEERKAAMAYRCPVLGNKPIISSKLHKEEPLPSIKSQPGNEKLLLKTAPQS